MPGLHGETKVQGAELCARWGVLSLALVRSPSSEMKKITLLTAFGADGVVDEETARSVSARMKSNGARGTEL